MHRIARPMFGRKHRHGNFWLKCIMDGGSGHLASVIATRALGTIASMIRANGITGMAWKGNGQCIPKTIAGVLRKRMDYLGWKVEDEWHWKLEREEEEGESWEINLRHIDGRTEEEWKKDRGRIMHLVRESFRRKSFMKFLDVKTRRFCINIDKRGYPEDRINAVRKVKGDGVTMAILVGADICPRHVSRRRKGRQE